MQEVVNTSSTIERALKAKVLFPALCAASLLIGSANAIAQAYPSKPVRIVTADGPGGGDDFIARLVAGKLSEHFGSQFIVENRPGAGGVIGQTLVAKASPDGYMLLLGGGSMAGAALVNAAVSYDILKDFTPVAMLETTSFVMLVNKTVPVQNVTDFIALARTRPGKLTFATVGTGQMPYWNAMSFNSMARINAVEIAYKSGPSAILDLISGQVDYTFLSVLLAVANKEKLRALAVTGAERAAMLPEVPTMSEAALPGYDMGSFRCILGPAGLNREIVTSLNTAINRALAMADIRDRFFKAGSAALASTPEEVSKRYADKISIFTKTAKEIGLKPQ